MDMKLELDNPPTHEVIKKATLQLKVGKSPGTDGIPAEVHQKGGEAGAAGGLRPRQLTLLSEKIQV